MRRMDDRRVRPEAAGLREQLDWTQAVLGDALLDLARLLVGVHVQRQRLRRRVRSEFFQPLARAPQSPLERVAVRVDEPRQAKGLGHPRILSAWPRARFRRLWRRSRTC